MVQGGHLYIAQFWLRRKSKRNSFVEILNNDMLRELTILMVAAAHQVLFCTGFVMHQICIRFCYAYFVMLVMLVDVQQFHGRLNDKNLQQYQRPKLKLSVLLDVVRDLSLANDVWIF